MNVKTNNWKKINRFTLLTILLLGILPLNLIEINGNVILQNNEVSRPRLLGTESSSHEIESVNVVTDNEIAFKDRDIITEAEENILKPQLNIDSVETDLLKLQDTSVDENWVTTFEDGLGRIWMIYTNFTNDIWTSSDVDIIGKYSWDYGITWSEEIPIQNNAWKDCQPSSLVTLNGTIWLFYSSARYHGDDYYDILAIKSVDNGNSWSTSINISISALYRDLRATAFSANNGTIFVIYDTTRGGGTVNNLFMVKSDDEGSKWSQPTILDVTNTGVNQQVGDSAIVANNGSIFVYGQELVSLWASFVYRSDDNGETWEKFQVTTYNQYLWGSMYIDSNFTLYVICTHINSNNNLFIMNSTDGGKTWTTPVQISSSPGSIDNSPSPYIDSLGNLWIAFSSSRGGDFDIYYNKYEEYDLLYNRFKYLGTYNSSFNNPMDIAINATGYMYVSETLNHKISIFDSEWNYITSFGSFGSGNGQFNFQYQIVINSTGFLFVADNENGRIQVFDMNGNYLDQWGNTELTGSRPAVLALNEDLGRFYVSDYDDDRICIYDLNGNYLSSFGSNGGGDGQFWAVRGIAVNETGYVYVSDGYNRIQIFDSSGNFVGKFGDTGSSDGQFNGPWRITFDSDSYLYVADRDNSRIQVFDSYNNYLDKFGTNGSNYGQMYYAACLTIDLDGKIHVSDGGNNRIQVFNPLYPRSAPKYQQTFVDDFNDGDISDWKIVGADWQVTNEKLTVTNAHTINPDWIIAPVNATSNWKASVDVYWESGTYFEAPFMVDADFTNDATYFWMETYSDSVGTIQVNYVELDPTWSSTHYIEKTIDIGLDCWQHFSFIRTNDQLECYINNTLLGVVNNAYDPGIQFGLSSFSASAEVIYFDNFIVEYNTSNIIYSNNFDENRPGWEENQPTKMYVDTDESWLYWNTDTTQINASEEVDITTQVGDSIEMIYTYKSHSDGNTRQSVNVGFTDSMYFYPYDQGWIYYTPSANFFGVQEMNYLGDVSMRIFIVVDGVQYFQHIFSSPNSPVTYHYQLEILNETHSWICVNNLNTSTTVLTEIFALDLTNVTFNYFGAWNHQAGDYAIQGTYEGLLQSVIYERNYIEEYNDTEPTYYEPFDTNVLNTWNEISGNYFVSNGVLEYSDTETAENFPKLEIPFVTADDWKITYHTRWVSGSYFEGGIFFDTVSLENWHGYYLAPSAYGADNLFIAYFYNLTYSPAIINAPYTWQKGVWYNITVIRSGENILAYVNDALIINITHAEPTPGDCFGIHCGSYTYENILFDNISITVDGVTNRIPFMFEQPDINYTVGDTGYNITWVPSDNDPAFYNISRNGVLVKDGTWNSSGEEIVIDVDGLGAGNYIYRCTVLDSIDQSYYDEVNVLVEDTSDGYLDQEYSETNQNAEGAVGTQSGILYDDAQGFIPNVTGYLSSVDLYLKVFMGTPTYDIIVEIFEGDIEPTGSPLMNSTIPAFSSTSLGWHTCSFGGNISLISGKQYWIVARNPNDPNNNFYTWGYDNSPSYQYGKGLQRTDSGAWYDSTIDWIFRTYMREPVVLIVRDEEAGWDEYWGNITERLESRGFLVEIRYFLPTDLTPYDVVVLHHGQAANTTAAPYLDAYLTIGGGVVTCSGMPSYLVGGGYNIAAISHWFGASTYANVGGIVYTQVDNPFNTTYLSGTSIDYSPGAAAAVNSLISNTTVIALWENNPNQIATFTHTYLLGRSVYSTPTINPTYKDASLAIFIEGIAWAAKLHNVIIGSSPLVDLLPPDINLPANITYTEGDTGYSIDWVAGDINPDTYIIYRDGVSIDSDSWINGSISIDVDGLTVGTYNYTIVVSDLEGNQAIDEVQVTVAGIEPSLTDLEQGLTKLLESTGSELLPEIFEDALERIWIAYTNNTNSNIYGKYSTDNGSTWSNAVEIVKRTGINSGPSVEVLPNGTILLFFTTTYINTNGDTHLTKSYDNGNSWTTPIAITSDAAIDDRLGTVFLAPNGTLWYVFGRYLGSSIYNLYTVTSNDFGKTWSLIKPFILSNDGIRQELDTRSVVTENGTIFFYGSEVSTYWASFVYKSVDNGSTWTKHQATPYDQYFHGTLFVDSNFTISVLCTQYLDARIFICNSTDGGVSWFPNPPTNISNGFDDNYIDAFIDSRGNLWIAFHSTRDGDYDIYYNVYLEYDKSYQSYNYVFTPSITSPEDIIYTEGETGNSITWTFTGVNPSKYTISRDGFDIKSGLWNDTSDTISISVDGLTIGNYNYRCYINDSYSHTVFDEVVVHVNAQEKTLNNIEIGLTKLVDSPGTEYNPEIFEDALGRIWIVYVNNSNTNIYAKYTSDNGSTWSDAVEIIKRSGINAVPSVEVLPNGTILLFFVSSFINTNADTFLTKSFDNGNSWTIPIPLTNDVVIDDSQGSAFLSPNGTLWYIFSRYLGGSIYNLYTITSNDFGDTWSSIKHFALNDNGIRQGLDTRSIVTKNGTIFIYGAEAPSVWASFVYKSTDNGTTWTKHQATPYDQYAWGTLFVDSNFTITILCAQYPNERIFICNSTDGGLTWTPYPPVNISDGIRDYSVDTFIDSSGNLWVSFHSTRDGDFDIYYNVYEAYDPLYQSYTYEFEPIISHPSDVAYTEGETGNSITWTLTGMNPSKYIITRDGVEIKSGSWNTSGETVMISVDGLSEDSYIYRCTINNTVGNAVYDEVTVTVESLAKTLNNLEIGLSKLFDSTEGELWSEIFEDALGRIWIAYSNNSYSTILGRCSTDNGSSWGSPVTIVERSGINSAPSVLVFPNGTILLFFSSTYINSNADVCLTISYNNGNSWSTPVALTNDGANEDYIGTAFLAPNGTLWYVYSSFRGGSIYNLYQLTSNDFGLTWSSIKPFILSSDGIRQEIDAQSIVTENGTILIKASEASTYWASFVYKSVDNGNSWTKHRATPYDYYFHGTFFIDSNFSISLLCVQHNDYRIFICNSTDGGLTWTPYPPVNISNGFNDDYIDAFIDSHGSLWISFHSTRDGDNDIYYNVYLEYDINYQSYDYVFTPSITSPENITYIDGETGNSISWTFTGINPSKYTISLDGVKIKTGLWNVSGETVMISVDGLSVDSYVYRCIINNTAGNAVYDEVTVTVDPTISPPTISNPANITYNYGDSGYNIGWTFTDTTPDPNWYNVTRNGILLLDGQWNSSGEILTISVDGLVEGTYLFKCTIYDDDWQSASHTVDVTVINDPPTISDESNFGYNDYDTGNTISWTATDYDPVLYNITRNGVLIQANTWNVSGEIITISVDGLSPGIYTYICTIADTRDQGVSDTVVVTVTNNPPIISDETDISYNEGQTGYILSWTATDADPVRYNVTLDGVLYKEGTWNSTGETIDIDVNGLSPGVYIYNCTIEDSRGQIASDLVQVTVSNDAPIISDESNFGYDDYDTGNTISWTTTDYDPFLYNITLDDVLIQANTWNSSGEIITIIVDGLNPGIYTYICTIADTRDQGASDTVVVTVTNNPPVIGNPSDITYDEDQSGYFASWTTSDSDPAKYNITRDGILIKQGIWNSSAEVISISVDEAIPGAYNYQCTIEDSRGQTDSHTIQVTVNDLHFTPEISSPDNIVYTFGHTGYSITWNATDADPDPDIYTIMRDGVTIKTGLWNSSGETITIIVDGLPADTYIYRCTVTDEYTLFSIDEVEVEVLPNPSPTIDSPENIVYVEGATGNFISWDPSDNDPSSYTIALDSLPIKSGAWNSSSETIVISVDGLVNGSYTYQCTVVDFIGQSTYNEVTVDVKSADSPSIDSPLDITYEEGMINHFITWDPSDTDPSSFIILRNGVVIHSGLWNHSSETISVNVDGLNIGSYTYNCTVIDEVGHSIYNLVIVTVIDNPLPSISSPDDVIYIFGITGHLISWSAADTYPATYTISRDSVPIKSGLWNSSSELISISVDGLPVGNYTYSCTVADVIGQEAYNEVNVEVNVNPPPTINSPSDITYTENDIDNVITWTAIDNDPDTYSITRNSVNIESDDWFSNDPISINIDGLLYGHYVYVITVTDLMGSSVTDTVIVDVEEYYVEPSLDHPSDIEYESGDAGNQITWIAYGTHPSSYTIYRDGTQITSLAWSTDGQTISVSVDGLGVGVYDYRCLLIDEKSAQANDYVTVTVIRTPKEPVINSPGNLDFFDDEASDYEIDWTGTDDNPASYKITRDSITIEEGVWTISPKHFIISLEGLEARPNTPYIFICKLIDEDGEEVTDEVHVTVKERLPPSPPKNLVGVGGDNKVTLSWDLPDSEGSDIIIRYVIYKSTDGSYYQSIATTELRTFVEKGLANRLTYYYKVTAENAFKESNASNVVKVIPMDPESTTTSEDTSGDLVTSSPGFSIFWTIIPMISLLVLFRRKQEK